MADTASDEFTRADPLYQHAWRHKGNTGQALHVEAPQRSGWPLFWIGFAALILVLGALAVQGAK